VDVTTNRIADSYDELRAYQNLGLNSGDEALKQLKNLFEEAKF
jgi:hypothetical protein